MQSDSLLDGEGGPAPPFKSIHVRVSEEPFTIPLEELQRHPGCMLAGAARFAAREGRFVGEGAARKPLVELARDVRAFRLLRSYLGSGELIVPPDPADRQLLLTEAGYYNIEGAVRILTIALDETPRYLPPPAACAAPVREARTRSGKECEGLDARATRVSRVEEAPVADGYCVPSARALRRCQKESAGPGGGKGKAKAADEDEMSGDGDEDGNESDSEGRETADGDRTYWFANDKTAKVSEPDLAIRAQEYPARIAFATDDQDGTALMREWVTVLFADAGAARAGEPPVDLAAAPAAPSYPLLRYPGSGGAPPIGLVASWAEFRRQWNALTLGLLGEVCIDLPLVCAGGGVLAALHEWPRRSVPSGPGAVKLAEGILEENFAAACYKHYHGDEANRPRRWRSYNTGDEIEVKKKLAALRREIERLKSPVGAAPRRLDPGDKDQLGLLAYMTLPNIDLVDEDDGELKFEWTTQDNVRSAPWHLRGRRQAAHAFHRPSARAASNNEQGEGEGEGEDSQAVQAPLVPREHERAYRSFQNTDLDLFLVTRDPDAALDALAELHRRLVAALPPSAEIHVLRTAQSVTFLLPRPYRSVQVILRLYHSVEHVLLGFDVDCCCVAYDGRRVVALPRAVRALRHRYNLVDPTRQSTTYEQRLVKYAKRGFSVALPGVDLAAEARATEVAVEIALRDKTYLQLAGMRLLLGMFYAVALEDLRLLALLGTRLSDYGYVATAARYVGRRVRAASWAGKLLPYAYGSDFAEVLTSAVCKASLYGRPYTCGASVPEMVAFQTRMPHAQDRVDQLFTGAFHPTVLDWASGASGASGEGGE